MNKQPTVFVIGLSGESLFFEVDHFNEPGETIVAHSLYTEPGGKGYNQAVALKKLGAKVHFLTVAGTDEYAQVIENDLEKRGVIPHIIKLDGEKSTRAVILTDKDGDNQVCVYPGVSNKVGPEIVERFEEIISTCDYLLMQQEYPLPVFERALRIDKKHNVKVIINPAPANLAFLPYLKEAFLITPNESEAKTIFGLSQDASIDELILKIKENVYPRIIVTLGAKGSLVYEANELTIIPALTLKPEEVLDTTGAGDTYTAATLYKMGCGESLVQAARFASIASGLSVTKKYVLEAIPSYAEIENYFKKQKVEL